MTYEDVEDCIYHDCMALTDDKNIKAVEKENTHDANDVRSTSNKKHSFDQTFDATSVVPEIQNNVDSWFRVSLLL